jgi:hypothetical protein
MTIVATPEGHVYIPTFEVVKLYLIVLNLLSATTAILYS